jgi:isobutyryl-CoA mutase
VMTPEYGAATQLEKIDMLDFADLIALNKFDKRGAMDALRDVKKQYQRNHLLFDTDPEEMPVFGTIASQFNDPGVNALYLALLEKIKEKTGVSFDTSMDKPFEMSEKLFIIPPKRVRYLSEIADTVRNYNEWAEKQSKLAQAYQSLRETLEMLGDKNDEKIFSVLGSMVQDAQQKLDPTTLKTIEGWEKKKKSYKDEYYIFRVRDKEIKIATHTESLSHLKIPKVSMPPFLAWGEIARWSLRENVPGEFPYAAGVFPFKREEEDPTRMFAGEGGPERTNRRFHYVSLNMPARRLSTAFDSVTLYGEDPDRRPDIYGKIGNSGVSIACLDDAKKLYSGFNLADPKTSVSMTINGPAPTLVGFFLNAAIDQQCELYIKENGLEAEVEMLIAEIYRQKGTKRPEYQGKLPVGNDGLGLFLLGVTGDMVLPKDVYERIKADTITKVRGTVQADILKEDQAQNTCIFSTDFSLKLMGDVQEYFITNKVRNFYSVSISGYHIAEAGANPVSQLAFTLANGFTYVEYYLSRGMHIDDFAPNLSFFFSNGIDPEFSVIGRVARLIWAKAMKNKYGGNERSQKLKYHIQTSGRSLHAQEIDFNDIRTTLQALYAIYDNCNSLHTNAYDEAITTPTEDSVRRAMAIQMIINHELGLAKNQNPLQGAFIIEELTELVEEAVMSEFDRITERGGVLGAMETMYQRGKIQEESLYYETLKHSGKLPIMGVNTFLSSKGSPTVTPGEVIRATPQEKEYQIAMLEQLQKTWADEAPNELKKLQEAATHNKNVFEALMDAVKYASLGQITRALFEVGGQYRRNM